MERKNFYGKGNNAFACRECGKCVEALSTGSFRNHCPYCLWSRHVDIVPGDRRETCLGMMQPRSLERHAKKGWMIVHECTACSKQQRNKAAPDDTMELLIGLTQR
jgi:hypothetical protein